MVNLIDPHGQFNWPTEVHRKSFSEEWNMNIYAIILNADYEEQLNQ